MKTIFLKYYPLIFGLLFLFTAYFTLLWISYLQNENHIIYSLDDAYIHMAMAKNFAAEGVWGVSKYEFASSSSSILWTSLLALIYYFFGPNEITPLILNLIFASLVIVCSYFILKRHNIKNSHVFLVLLLLNVVTPLPPLMFTGLEHVFHILVSLLFIFSVSELLIESTSDRKNLIWLVILAVMLPAIRYEGIFLVMVAAILFIFKRKSAIGILILIFSFVPVFIFGLISVKNGWSFFPNSLLLKGSFPDITSFDEFFAFTIVLFNIFLPTRYWTIIIPGLLIGSVSAYFFLKSRYRTILDMKITYLIILFIANLILYAAYSKSGWSYRYQSFLVALGIIITSILFFKYILRDYRKNIIVNSVLTAVLVVIPSICFLISGINLMANTPRSSTNKYEQQYQMGQFLKKYYSCKVVALNDIGAANYFADIKSIDLWGLGNLEVSKKRRKSGFSTEDMTNISAKYGVDIAIIYDSWFAEGDSTVIPGQWVKAGEWEIRDNIIAGDNKVSFYEVNSRETQLLEENLNDFSRSLPRSVIQKKVNTSK